MSCLVIGGARSGKSSMAEKRAQAKAREKNWPLLYVATAQARDGEMRERIAMHQQQRRNVGWQTLEETLAIDTILTDHAQHVILVDCLTLWLSNLMEAKWNIADATASLCDAIFSSESEVILVANEVGLGIVPDNALARAFRDHAGQINQRVASVCDQVIFMAAGLPMVMKGDIR